MFAGTCVFIFGGRLIADKLSANQEVLYSTVGTIFILTALIQVRKMRQKKRAVFGAEQLVKTKIPLEKTVDSL
jgi:predicted glycosyltransferase